MTMIFLLDQSELLLIHTPCSLQLEISARIILAKMKQHVSIFKIVIVVNVNWDFLGLIAKRVSKQFRLAFK